VIPFLLGVAAVTALSAMNRRRLGRAVEAKYRAQYPPDTMGIAQGAEGYVLPGTNDRGLLLLHGSGDSPQSLRHLAAALNAVGYEVHAPLLPGHGRSPSAFAAATADDYHAAVARALDAVMCRNAWTGVVGLSMGAALATRAVSESTGVSVLVLLAPYMIPPRTVRATVRAAALWSAFVPFVRGRGDDSIHDPAARDQSIAYGTFSKGALTALVGAADAGFRALPQIRIPTLVVNSTQDNRIPRELAEQVLRTITAPLEQHWLEGCGHVITTDYCKDEVAKLVVAFLARHAG
jgi:carboxylesterase